MTLTQELQSFVRFYFVDSDFMQLVDSTFTACMQCTGFTTGTLYCILYNVYRLRFYAASG